MSGRLKIVGVVDTDYYLSKVGGGLNYYLTPASNGMEPPGVWVGRGAADLGLHGLVKPEVMKKLCEQGIAPDGRRIGRKRPVYRGNEGKTDELAERIDALIAEEIATKGSCITDERREEITRGELAKVKHAVVAWDFTWSVAKSISLTHFGLLAQVAQAQAAGDTEIAERAQQQANLIIDAIRETAREIIARFEQTACYTQTGGFHGAGGDGAYRDGKGVIAAAFLQSTNRNHDPHLHIHTVVANLVQRADGEDDKYRTLYGRRAVLERDDAAPVPVHRLCSSGHGRVSRGCSRRMPAPATCAVRARNGQHGNRMAPAWVHRYR
jgi:hypothetical protein